MLVVVQPTITFFKIAQESQTLFFVRQEQSNLSEELNTRDDRIRKKYEEIPSVDKELTRKRLANTLDVYADYFFGTKYSSDPLTGGSVGSDQSDPFVHKALRLIMPLYDEYSVQARAFTSNQADDGLWCRTQVPDSGIGDGWGRQRAELLRRFPLQNVVRKIGTSSRHLQLPKNGTWPISFLWVSRLWCDFSCISGVRLLVKMLFHASEDILPGTESAPGLRKTSLFTPSGLEGQADERDSKPKDQNIRPGEDGWFRDRSGGCESRRYKHCHRSF
jgi:hypothetical protein